MTGRINDENILDKNRWKITKNDKVPKTGKENCKYFQRKKVKLLDWQSQLTNLYSIENQ